MAPFLGSCLLPCGDQGVLEVYISVRWNNDAVQLNSNEDEGQ